MPRKLRVLWTVCMILGIGTAAERHKTPAQGSNQPATPTVVPKTWDDQAMARLEVPLANPLGSPKHIASDYYYRIPVRTIYKAIRFTLPLMSLPATSAG
jgi:hypothetical protein